MEEQAKYETKAGATTITDPETSGRDFDQIMTKLETLAGLIGAKEAEGLDGPEIAGIAFTLSDLADEIRAERRRRGLVQA